MTLHKASPLSLFGLGWRRLTLSHSLFVPESGGTIKRASAGLGLGAQLRMELPRTSRLSTIRSQ